MPLIVEALKRACRGSRVPTPRGGARATVAAIFRKAGGAEQVLVIRRQVRAHDPWSGHVALPGGRQDAHDNGCDERTAIRETGEEVGLDLSEAGAFEPLGRLVDDRVNHPMGGRSDDRRGRALVVSLFGFVARPDAPASAFKLAPSADEVADAWWIDTAAIDARELCWREVDLLDEAPAKRAPAPLVAAIRALGLGRMRFAAINLPPPPNRAASAAGGKSVHTAAATAAAPATATPAAATPANAFQLWGLTLAFFSDVLRVSAAGTPLVGEGAPADFRDAYGPALGGRVARAALRAYEAASSLRRRIQRTIE